MWWMLLTSSWAASPETVAVDRAHEALAAGDVDRAVQALRTGLTRTTDDAGRARVRCVLGAALLTAARPEEAEAELVKVPLAATCGPRAAFLRAEAMARSGRVSEAAALFEGVGGPLLGEDAHASSAEAVVALAEKLLADPDRGRHTAIALLQQTLTFDLAPERAARIARTLAGVVEGYDEAACGGLLAGLSARDEVEDRRLAGKVCDPAVVPTLLAALPADDPSRWWYLAKVADGPAATELRLKAVAESDDEGRWSETLADLVEDRDLRALPLLDARGTPDALRTRAELLAAKGDLEAAVARLAEHLERFPTDPHRAEVASAHAGALLAWGRARWAANDAEGALRAFDQLSASYPSHAAAGSAGIEAGYVLRATGRPEDARRRWEEVLARHPGRAEDALAALARQQAFDQGDVALGMDRLRRAREAWGGGEQELASWREVALAATAPGRVTAAPVVQVRARNVPQVQLAVHAIDLEALVRGGRGPSELRDLDVAAIAPQQTYTVPVPGYAPHRDIAFDAPVRARGSGLYSVSVTADDQVARVTVLVSDLVVVARRVGADLAVATFDSDGDPVGNARVLVWAGGTFEGRTDGTGLWVGRDVPTSAAIVLAERGGDWAIAQLPEVWSAPAAVHEVRAEVERSRVHPGDEVGVRLIGRRPDGTPRAGEWVVWLSGAVETAPVRARADSLGIAVASLQVPSIEGWAGRHPEAAHWSVMAIAPDATEPTAVASLTSAALDADARVVEHAFDGADLVVTVRDGAGAPVPSAPVTWEGGGAARADASGRVRIPGPRAGLPWTVSYQIPGGPSGSAVRSAASPIAPRLHAATDHWRPGEAPAIGVELTRDADRTLSGTVTVRLFRLHEVKAEPPVLADPWRPAPSALGISGPISWTGDEAGAPDTLRELVWTGAVEVTAGQVAPIPLPMLEEGKYLLSAGVDGGTSSAERTLEVSERGLRWVGLVDPGPFVDELHLGDRLSVGVDGASALLVAGGSRVLWAAVVAPGARRSVEVDATWEPTVTWSALAPDGQVEVARTPVDLHLTVTVSADGGPVGVRVTTAHGVPVPGAAVALTAWDRTSPAPEALADARRLGSATTSGAVGADLRDVALGEALSAALIEEAEWQAEAERTVVGLEGVLSDNRLADALLGEVPLAEGESAGMGGLGSRGMGAGGSGYGQGGGVFGVARRGVGDLPGLRVRYLWAQLVTDRSGSASVPWAAPPGRYVVRATAVHASGEGLGEAEIDTDRPRLVIREPTPGRADERAAPRVTVLNPTDRELGGVVSVGDAELVVQLPPDSATTLDLGEPVAPGPAPRLVRFAIDGGDTLVAPWRFPLDPGHVSAIGPLVVTAGGSDPAALVAARVAPEEEPWMVAVRGRAVLAAWTRRPDPHLARIVRDSYERLDLVNGWPDAVVGATGLLFLVDARRSGLVDVADAELEALAAQIPPPVTATERAWLVRARQAAGLPIDGTLVDLLRADPVSSAVAAARIALGEPMPAETGYGPEVAAALRQRKDPAFVSAPMLMLGPPDPGDPTLPEWVAAVAGLLPVGGPAEIVVSSGEPPQLGYSWHAAPRASGEAPLRLHTVPGELAETDVGSGDRCDPCTVQVGDWLVGDWVGGGTGLRPRRLDGWPALEATHRGVFTVIGKNEDGESTAPITVQVLERRGPLGVNAAVALAERAVVVREAPELPAGELPSGLARRAARVAFDDAVLRGDDRTVAATFRTLAATDPTAAVPLHAVARAARALAASGDPAGAVRVWKAGLDAAFAREVAVLGGLESAGGALVSIQKVREAASRYPNGPLVAETAYLLPARLHALAEDGLPAEVVGAGIRPADVELTAAAWDREFLANYPDHPLATAAGMRLARTLLVLGAADQAAAWSARVREANPDAALVDGLVLLEALAATEAGAAGHADRLLNELVGRPWRNEAGTLDASEHTPDAWVAIGRLREAAGDPRRARAAYEAAGTDAAARSLAALDASALSAPPVVRWAAGDAARLRVEAVNLDEVRIRAYPIDLRTVFLRDLGLETVTDIDVTGVSPSWSGTRVLDAGAFRVGRDLDLPLTGVGAWLVQIEGDGHLVASLVVRSSLSLSERDLGGVRRVEVRRGDGPAAGLDVRAIANGEVIRATTDVRGVVELPLRAPVLAWRGEDWAFTDPAPAPSGGDWMPPVVTDGLGGLLKGLDDRVRRQRDQDEAKYREQFDDASDELGLATL